MKQSLLSLMKNGILYRLKKSMTENSKNACWLLLSVILMTGTVTGMAGPLDSCVQKMTDRTKVMQKEIALYREFAACRDRVKKQAQQRTALEKLQEQLPEKADAEKEMKRIYRLAGFHGITLHNFKQIPDNPVHLKTSKERIDRLLWEVELSGTWYDLISFFNDIETQGPCTRMEALQVRKPGETGKIIVPSGTGKCTELTVKGRICVYSFCKKATA